MREDSSLRASRSVADLGRQECAHTPGPWRVIRNTGIIAAADCHVAKVGDFADKQLLPFNRKRWEADAALIASAPSLASAASGMLGKLEGPQPIRVEGRTVVLICSSYGAAAEVRDAILSLARALGIKES